MFQIRMRFLFPVLYGIVCVASLPSSGSNLPLYIKSGMVIQNRMMQCHFHSKSIRTLPSLLHYTSIPVVHAKTDRDRSSNFNSKMEADVSSIEDTFFYRILYFMRQFVRFLWSCLEYSVRMLFPYSEHSPERPQTRPSSQNLKHFQMERLDDELNDNKIRNKRAHLHSKKNMDMDSPKIQCSPHPELSDAQLDALCGMDGEDAELWRTMISAVYEHVHTVNVENVSSNSENKNVQLLRSRELLESEEEIEEVALEKPTLLSRIWRTHHILGTVSTTFFWLLGIIECLCSTRFAIPVERTES